MPAIYCDKCINFVKSSLHILNSFAYIKNDSHNLTTVLK